MKQVQKSTVVLSAVVLLSSSLSYAMDKRDFVVAGLVAKEIFNGCSSLFGKQKSGMEKLHENPKSTFALLRGWITDEEFEELYTGKVKKQNQNLIKLHLNPLMY